MIILRVRLHTNEVFQTTVGNPSSLFQLASLLDCSDKVIAFTVSDFYGVQSPSLYGFGGYHEWNKWKEKCF